MSKQIVQKYLAPATDELSELIERYNLLSPQIDLVRLGVSSNDASNWADSGNRYSKYQKPPERWTEAARYTLSENLEFLSEHFADYIWGDARPISDILFESYEPNFDIKSLWYPTLQAVIRYENFLQLRHQFKLLVAFAFKHPSWLNQFKNTNRSTQTKKMRFVLEKFEKSKMPEGDFPPPLLGNVRFKVDEEGIIYTELDEFSEAINKVDVRRIRECLNIKCSKIFWAGRIDKFCCSSACNNLLNIRLIRSENLTSEENEIRNLQKRQNRDFKRKKA